jgi:hypothetical protein
MRRGSRLNNGPRRERGSDPVSEAVRWVRESVPRGPDEAEIAHALAWEGPAPAFLLLGGGELFFREYLLQLTSVRLILVPFSQLRDKPRRKVYAVDRDKLTVERWKRSVSGWTSMWLRWPGPRRAMRLNIDPAWEPEADKFQRELSPSVS